MLDRIFLRGVDIHARHGVHEEEARLGQRFIVDIDYWIDTSEAVISDEYDDTVGYEQVFSTLHEVSAAQRYRLLEALADAMARAVLDRFPRIAKVRVEIHKPSAPIPGIFSDAGVEVIRAR